MKASDLWGTPSASKTHGFTVLCGTQNSTKSSRDLAATRRQKMPIMTARQIDELQAIRDEQDGAGDRDEWCEAQHRTLADKKQDPDFIAFFGCGTGDRFLFGGA